MIDDRGARTLAWDGCVNVRDLGGIPTEDGLRSDQIERLRKRLR